MRETAKQLGGWRRIVLQRLGDLLLLLSDIPRSLDTSDRRGNRGSQIRVDRSIGRIFVPDYVCHPPVAMLDT